MEEQLQKIQDFLNSDEFARDEQIGLEILGTIVTQTDIDGVAGDQFSQKKAKYIAADAAQPTMPGHTGFDLLKADAGPNDGGLHFLRGRCGELCKPILYVEAFRKRMWDMAFIAASKFITVPASAIKDAPDGWEQGPIFS